MKYLAMLWASLALAACAPQEKLEANVWETKTVKYAFASIPAECRTKIATKAKPKDADMSIAAGGTELRSFVVKDKSNVALHNRCAEFNAKHGRKK